MLTFDATARTLSMDDHNDVIAALDFTKRHQEITWQLYYRGTTAHGEAFYREIHTVAKDHKTYINDMGAEDHLIICHDFLKGSSFSRAHLEGQFYLIRELNTLLINPAFPAIRELISIIFGVVSESVLVSAALSGKRQAAAEREAGIAHRYVQYVMNQPIIEVATPPELPPELVKLLGARASKFILKNLER